MSRHKNHYVYGLFREGAVFYVGRGTGDRMYQHFGKELRRDTNEHKNAVIRKCRENGTKCEARKLFSGLTKTEVVRTEQALLDCLFEVLTNKSKNASDGGAEISDTGSECWSTELTEQEVAEIKWYIQNKEINYTTLAEEYNSSIPSIGRIARGETWKHVDRTCKPDSPLDGDKKTRYFLDKKDVARVKWMAENTPVNVRAIGEHFGMKKSTANGIISEECHHDVEPKKPDNYKSIAKEIREPHELFGEEVAKIRWVMRNTGITLKDAIAKFGLNKGVLQRIKHGKKKPGVGCERPENADEILSEYGENTRKNNTSLTEQDVREINWLLENSDKTQKEIASHYSCASSTVSDIKNGYNWQHVDKSVKPV